MANITIKEILASENLFNLRVIVNQNFYNIASSVNNILKYLDTSATGSAINTGSILIKKYSNPTTTILFTNEGSGVVNGNQTIGGNLSVTGNSLFSGDSRFTAGILVDGTSPGNHIFDIKIPQKYEKGEVITQFDGSSTPIYNKIKPNTLSASPSSTKRNLFDTSSISSSDFLKHRVIRLDFSDYTGSAPTDCTEIVLPSVSLVTKGQILTFLIDDYPASAPTTIFKISNDNLDPSITAPIILNSTILSNSANMKKIYVTFFADTNGWRVLSSHKDVSY